MGVLLYTLGICCPIKSKDTKKSYIECETWWASDMKANIESESFRLRGQSVYERYIKEEEQYNCKWLLNVFVIYYFFWWISCTILNGHAKPKCIIIMHYTHRYSLLPYKSQNETKFFKKSFRVCCATQFRTTSNRWSFYLTMQCALMGPNFHSWFDF